MGTIFKKAGTLEKVGTMRYILEKVGTPVKVGTIKVGTSRYSFKK